MVSIGLVWLVLVITFVALDIILWARRKGGTFTSYVKPWIREHKLLTLAAALFWLWLGYHFFIEA